MLKNFVYEKKFGVVERNGDGRWTKIANFFHGANSQSQVCIVSDYLSRYGASSRPPKFNLFFALHCLRHHIDTAFRHPSPNQCHRHHTTGTDLSLNFLIYVTHSHRKFTSRHATCTYHFEKNKRARIYDTQDNVERSQYSGYCSFSTPRGIRWPWMLSINQ